MINRPAKQTFNKVLQSCLLAAGLAGPAIMLLFVSGCAGTTPVEAVPEVQQDLVWPPPPEQARIRYLGQIHLLGETKKDRKLSLTDILLGKDVEVVKHPSLVKPYAVHSDSKGRVFITDSTIASLVVFDLETENAEFWGASGPGKLSKPMGVTADAKGNVYVSDISNDAVFVFDSNGSYLKAFGGKNVLTNPVGLAFNDLSQRLYVVDTQQHQIVVFNREGNVEFTIGQRGGEPGNFNFPTNIAIDDNGRLYVADTMNFRIQVLESDGTVVRVFGEVGNRPGDINRLKGIGVDSEGNIYAVDASFDNFQIFNQEGKLLLNVGKGGAKRGRFSLPAGAHVDKNNRIFISDQFNHRIQMFERIGTSLTEGISIPASAQ